MNALTKAMIKPALGMIKPEMIKEQIKNNIGPLLEHLDQFIDKHIQIEEGSNEHEVAITLKRGISNQGEKTIYAYPVTLDNMGRTVRVVSRFDLREIAETLDVESYLEKVKNSL